MHLKQVNTIYYKLTEVNLQKTVHLKQVNILQTYLFLIVLEHFFFNGPKHYYLTVV